ncbi:MAG: septum formation initiator family protein [Clostridiales bacterium]|nr:septum formation initiator family protein [Clostridiales bacterium]
MRRRNKNGTGIIVFVVLCLFGVVAFGKIKLEERKKDLESKISNLESQLVEEEERAKEIRNLEAYVQTKKYIEEVAREKLGMVYEDEIIFKEDDK